MTENTRWMIVDDNEQILLLLAAMIQHMTNAEVECYNSPEAALAAFRATPGKYELVITDFEMPEMDGVELCRRIREIAPGQEIFLATGSGFFTEEAAYQAGFAALLNKPFPLSALHAALAGAGLETEAISLAA
jgi:CheY-like chemotaxis protein